ncbi:hypothetical protein OPT61_g738 [Boeremia exigua]|uniref:Uncharacterized protein n=1 Tax=Boeremia exigua TaxID=749465 RepID=A0ACC2ISQ6_9PLEO|nr:hypothetical protein OPT61_g738 [Boeremia exigua]
MNDRYLIREVETRQELDEVLDVIWAANHTPYEPFIQLFFPVLGFTAAHREAALIDSRERFWKQHISDPSSHWLYVFDAVTGKAVGCSQWVISTVNPFAKGVPTLEAPWWPEGECRRFCESILNQVYRPRANWMTRPHCALNWMAVHPAHRLCGIGSLLMKSGIEKADSLNLECWLEGSSMGKPLYEKFGFQSLLRLAFDTDKSNASDEWRKCAHEMTPAAIFAMWRPRRGVWRLDNGQEVGLPWTLGTQPGLNGVSYE